MVGGRVIFGYKYPVSECTRQYWIKKEIRLSAEAFESFLNRSLKKYDFIEHNRGWMYSEDGAFHCLLITGVGRPDGVLVESEGYEYARYAAYIPDVTSLRYPSLMVLNRRLSDAVDFIIDKRKEDPEVPGRKFSFNELGVNPDLNISEQPFIQNVLIEMLKDRPEVIEVSLKEGGFVIQFDTNYDISWMRN